MKLKSLKITTALLLVLSFQTTYVIAGDDADIPVAIPGQSEFDSMSCLSNEITRNTKGWTQAMKDACQTLANKMDNARQITDEGRKKNAENSAIGEFNNKSLEIYQAKEAAVARRKASQSEGHYGIKYCSGPKTKPADAEAVMPYGSSSLGKCDQYAMGNMKNIYPSGNSSRNKINWLEFIQYSCSDKCNQKQGTTDLFETCVSDGIKHAKKCESVAYIINSYGRSWKNEEHVAAVEGNSSSGQIGARTQQASNGSTASVAIGAASAIKCVSKGIETVDYDACKKFQVQLDLIEGVQQVGYATQELVYKDKMIDSQMKYAAEENTATGALKAQGDSLKDQQSMYQQRTAVDAVKLGYLYTIYNEFPKSSEVKAKCEEAVRAINLNKDYLGNNEVALEDCTSAVTTGQGGFAMTMNQQQIEAMRSKLIGIATSAGSNMLLASLLGKRADDVDNAIAKIDAFQPVDPFTTTEADAQTTFCRMNPGVASCLTGDLERTFDTMNDNIITFGDGATGTSYGRNTNADGTVISSGLSDSSTRSAVGPVGSVIAAAAQDNSMENSDAAKVNTSGTGTSGGGGSGGGSAGGGGGGGGSPSAAGAAGQAAAIASRAPNYNGGGSFSVMGGFGINKKKAEGKVEDNPFGKLFGKDGAKGGEVNFRDIASQKVGGKGDNLFDMISKRYSSVNADKRLLEYELKK